jgi:GT2 family glycosyltransferase
MTGSGVAVIIVNWNSEQDLQKCLDALSRQSIPPSRVIVLDNGSRDFNAQSWKKRHPGVEFHSLKENLGFAAASNMGASIASDCQWLAFLNPDAFPEPDWLEVLIKASKSNPAFNLFAGLMVSALKPNIIDGTGEVYHSCGWAWRRDHLSELSDRVMEREEVFGACGGAAFVSRRAFMDAGGFDESYFCYFEDVDLSFRLRLLGGRCLFIPEARVNHVGNGATNKWSDFAVYHGHRNLVFTYVKNMPSFLFWYYLPQHVLLNIFSLFWCARRGQGGIVAKAKWDAIRRLSTIWKVRKRIQKRKIVSTASVAKMLTRGFTRHTYLKNF